MEIIKTSDGKICFKKEDYVRHNVGSYGSFTLCSSEMVVYTKIATHPFERGRIFKYDSAAEAVKYSKEITEQLTAKSTDAVVSSLREDALEWFFAKGEIEKNDLKDKHFQDVPIQRSSQWGYHFTFGQIEQMFVKECKKMKLKQVWSNDVRLPKVLGLSNQFGDWCYRWKEVKSAKPAYIEEAESLDRKIKSKDSFDCYQPISDTNKPRIARLTEQCHLKHTGKNHEFDRAIEE